MTTTVNTYATLQAATNTIETIAKGFAAIHNCGYLATDAAIGLNTIDTDFNAFEANNMIDNGFFTDSYPYVFYFAWRSMGCETGTNRDEVKARCKTLGNPFAVAKMTYNGKDFTITIKQA